MFDRADLILARLRAPLRFTGALLLLWLLFEAVLYRSGLYVQLAEPDSNTGAVVNVLQLLEREYRPGARHVLVFGDSRIGEGFSMAIANRTEPSLRFINVSVPGSTPRTWSYLLRAIDRAGYSYEAVVLGTPYEPVDRVLDDDWPLDPAHQMPLIDLRDASAYPRTFASDAMRDRARDAVLLPALAMQRDTRDLLANPFKRARRVLRYRPGLLQAIAQYGGHEESMPDLTFASDGRVTDWSHATPAQRASIDAHIGDLRAMIDPAIAQGNRTYLATWLGDIAQRAARRHARAILLPLARGPYSPLLGPHAATSPAVDAIAGHANAVALPADTLAELERPQFFFDAMHPNRAGRERTSAILATRVRDLLQAAPQ